MTSRTESHAASPVWGARPEWRLPQELGRRAGSKDHVTARTTPRAAGPTASRAAPALFQLGGPRRMISSELTAAAVLAALWIALWALFTAGVVERAAALHGAPSTPPAVSGEAALASTDV